jgi:hypothetical protein
VLAYVLKRSGTIMQTKSFAYLRVSGKRQIDGGGFPRQRAAVKNYADSRGIRIVKYFEELGVSGTRDLEDREEHRCPEAPRCTSTDARDGREV